MKQYTAREILRVLYDDGWYIEKQSGSHIKLKHPEKTGYVTVPQRGSKPLRIKTSKSIFQQAGLDPDRN